MPFSKHLTKCEARSYVYAGTKSVLVYAEVSWNKKVANASLIATLFDLSLFLKLKGNFV